MTTSGSWISAFHNRLLTGLASSGKGSESTAVEATGQPEYNGHVASFVFLVAGLEKSLRDTASPILFDAGTSFKQSRTSLGAGNSFTVERAEWKSRSPLGLEASHASKWGKYVALKYVRRMDDSRESMNWKEVLLEIRALLHEPIRYHPNIVRFLGLCWGAAEGTRSNLPVLVLEYSEFGSLAHLQTNTSDPFSFKVKKKLCHDVSKGLSILHACDIVHGDLKHENVLIYRNKIDNADVVFTAKLADFGGSVMDLVRGELSLHTGTHPYNAPEVAAQLNAEELKLTDVYSFGLLVWRVILDGVHLLQGVSREDIDSFKRSNALLGMAKESVDATSAGLDHEERKSVDYILEKTIQADPQDRNLRLTVAALQVER